MERPDDMQRLKSEGFNRIFRHSVGELGGGKKQTYDGGGNGRTLQFSSDSDDSDRNLAQTTHCVRSDSDSDSDHKKWTKNPLVVRRVKRSDKLKQAEKRLSGTEKSVSAADNRDGAFYHGTEESRGRTINLGGKNANSNDSGSGYKGSNKYQKLEAMRKMRLNLSVTSDEENAPPVRPPRWSGSSIRNFHMTSRGAEPESSPKINHPQSPASQPQSSAIYKVHSAPGSNTSTQKQHYQHIIKTTSPLSNFNTVLNQQVPGHQPQLSVPGSRQPFNLQSHMTASPQPFYKITEVSSLKPYPAVSSSTPDVTIHKFTSQVRIPFTDSTQDSSSRTTPYARFASQPATISQNLGHTQARESPSQQSFQAANVSQPSPHYNDKLEKGLKTTTDDRSKSSHKIPIKSPSNSGPLYQNDDSLDELVESNIQYLKSENDKAKTKKSSSTHVMMFSSLPDRRKISSGASSNTPLQAQPSIQVQASTNIQLHVSLPTDTNHSNTNIAPPIIQIASSSGNDYHPRYGFGNQLISQPDIIPKNLSRGIYTRSSQVSSEYDDRTDMSKSDNQVDVGPSYLGKHLQPEAISARVNIINRQARSDTEGNLRAPQLDRGMFSDVEYDIEVSERVKKWETFMKVQPPADKNSLITVHENIEDETYVLPGSDDVRKPVLLGKQSEFESPNSNEFVHSSSTRSKQLSSDRSIQKSENKTAPNALSVETNARRFCEVSQDPRFNVVPQSKSRVINVPKSLRPEKTFTSASELREQILENRLHSRPVTSGPVRATYQPALPQAYGYHTSSQSDTPVARRTSHSADARDAEKRGSKYREELDEISNVKSDSVINLRRRFDTDSATVTSEDDKKSVSTASAKLARPSKESAMQKETTDWSKVLPGYHTKIKDSDVWSPNLESTQGVPVSIERVTARTLQTIPFSEDPFWKELEQMTTFDPTSTAGHLDVSKAQDRMSTIEPVRSHQYLELIPPQSATLPNQSRNYVMPVTDRMQKSKSLYTPNIIPLTVDVSEKTPSRAVIALDDALNDITRSTIDRKQLSPKKRYMEPVVTSTTSGISNISRYTKIQPETRQSSTFEKGQFTFTKPGTESHTLSFKPNAFGRQDHGRHETVTSQSKQPMQFYQLQKEQQQPITQNRQSQMSQSCVNSYQLDPNLLRQKLLCTGLVIETDNEEPLDRMKYQSSSLRKSAQDMSTASSFTAPSYATMASQFNKSVLSEAPTALRSSKASSQPGTVHAANVNASLPWSMKQPGTKTLDDIQKALAPFRSTSYQPDPETLYGTSRLQSFKEPKFDTSRGPHTSATGWSYRTDLDKDIEQSPTNESSLSSSSSRLQQVNESMDDLKNLARDVEHRINEIKNKLEGADENSLDSILFSLKKLTPEVKSQEGELATFEDYYTAKKSKLSDALAELERINKSLELNTDDFRNLQERSNFKPNTSNQFVLGSQPKSMHLRPMQTRISSMFVHGLDTSKKSEDKESEFDVISKSFQAIVDEVNQTTDLLSRAVERSRQENVAPEKQKQTFKITVKPGNTEKTNTSAKSFLITDVVSTSQTSPFPVYPELEGKALGGRFRSKMQNNLGVEEDVGFDKPTSELLPDQESRTESLLRTAIQGSAGGNLVLQKAGPNIVKVTASATTTSAPSFSSTKQQQTRVRPVKDNKIIQEDRVTKKENNEKGLRVASSPSPTASRKIIPNSYQEPDIQIKLPQMTQDASEEHVAETNGVQLQVSKKKHAQNLEDTGIKNSTETERELSPSFGKKAIFSKQNVRSEILVPVSASPTDADSSLRLTSRIEIDKVPITLHITASTPMETESSNHHSRVSENSTIPARDSNQPSSVLPGCKLDDSENTSSGGHKTKRRLGTGVAMMLDKFSSGKTKVDGLHKRPVTQNEPFLTGSGTDDDNNEEHKQSVQTQPIDTAGSKAKHERNLKSPVRSLPKKTPIFSVGGRPSVVSSLERKIIDSETKTISSVTSSPQPSSPVSKPPQSPWKRHTSDPEKQSVADALKVGSPKFVTKIARPLSLSGSEPSDGYFTPKEMDSPRQGVGSPGVVSSGVKPADRKLQTHSTKGRPHSFHELMSFFQKDQGRLPTFDKFRKCASADEVNSDILVGRVLQSGQIPTEGVAT